MTAVSPQMVIDEAKKYLGWAYGYRDRCGGSYHELDCSGLICKVMNNLGLYIGCITSFVFAQMAWDHGLVIPREKALEIPCLLIEGPNQGRGPSRRANGADGHIILCDKTYSVEERGHAYGCVTVPLDWNRIQSFAIASWIPGVDYTQSIVIPTKPQEQEDMIILAPARQQKNPNRPACARLDLETGQVGMLNGARIHQLKPPATTAQVPVPANSQVRGWYETFNANGSKKGFKVIGSKDASGNPAYEYTWR